MKINSNLPYNKSKVNTIYYIVEFRHFAELLSFLIDNKDEYNFSFYDEKESCYMELDISRGTCTHFFIRNRQKGFFDKLLFPEFWSRFVCDNNYEQLRVNAFKK